MNANQFNELLKERISKIEVVLARKQKEYATGPDVLESFKIAARIDDEPPEKALWGMAKKHLVSLIMLLRNPKNRTPDLIDEKLGDFINYLILLEAIFSENSKNGIISTHCSLCGRPLPERQTPSEYAAICPLCSEVDLSKISLGQGL